MKCPKCQAENPAVRKFCRKCGTKLILACAQCGFENLPDDLFCGGCGYDLRKPPEALPFDYSVPKSYTPKFLAEKIFTTRSAMEGERKLVTVLFADVANFTTLSEKLDPEEVHGIMDGCFKILMDEIHKYEGTINQFTGDGVMALFGAPVAHEDHAGRACHAALAIQNGIEEYGEMVARDYGAEFKMRIGLNSGPVIVGAIGDDLRMDYTAVGDTTNLASRMQTMAQPGTVLLSKNTHRLVKEYFELKPLGKLEVKGREEPQEVFELTKSGRAATRLEASVLKGLTKFVGREHFVDALMETFEKVKNGTGQVVGVVGEAGVGKSRLLFEVRNRLPQGEFNYFEGRCIHYGGTMPYLPVLGILRSYFEISEGERESVIRKRVRERIINLGEKLQDALPPIQDLLSLKVEDEGYMKLEPKQRKEKVFEALRDLIIRGSHERPLVIAIEDLHWIDKTSEEFLDYFIGWLANVKVMLILLHRPEYTHRWGSKSYFNRIGLDQLTLESSAELVRAILQGGETAPELNNLILNRAAGNPLFMEELTHSLLENGSIQMRDQCYVLARRPSDLQVPDTIQGIIAARIDRLEENLKRIMQVASVIGREFAFRLLQAISGMREDLKSQLLNLQGLEFIYEKSLFPELEYIFKHAMTQEVAYSSLLLKRRRDIHQAVGKAIEELYPEKLEEFYEMLAYHYARGEVLEKASQYLKLSGSKAARNHSLWEAYSSYKEALAALHRLPDSVENKKEKLEVLVLMTAPMRILGFPEGSFEMLQQGESLSKDLRDNRRLALFYGSLSAYYSYRGDPLLAVKYSEDALEKGRKSQDIDVIVPTAVGLCFSCLGTGRFDKVVDIVPGVLQLIEKQGRQSEFFAMHVNPYSQLCAYCGQSMGFLGNFEEGRIFLEKGLRHAAQVGDLASSGLVEFCYGVLLHIKGEWKPAIEHLRNSIKHCEEAKFLAALAWSWAFLGSVYSNLGDPETGRSYVEKGLKIQQDSGFEYLSYICPFFLSEIYLQLGDLKNARSSADEALTLSLRISDKFGEGMSRINLGRMLLWQAETVQTDKAEEYILQGMMIMDELKLRPNYGLGCLFLGEFYVHVGRKEKAVEDLKKAEAMFQEMGMDYWLGKSQEALKRL